MNRTASTLLTLLTLFVVFIGSVLLNNTLLSDVRLDLTESKVYSLSEGSQAVIADIDEPINLYFFFSDSATKGMVGLRNYAARVESLLEAYAAQANGTIRLQVIDPEPFSVDEDRAAEFGLTGAQVGMAGDSVYFGLAATNSLDDQAIIGFFDPQQEQFLEYEISKLLYQLGDPEQPHIALITDLPVDGAQNPMTGQFDPAMTFYTQLQQFYTVTVVSATAESLPEGTDLIVMAHANKLSDSLRYAVDQHVMQTGKLLVFADPLFESTMMGMPGMASQASLLTDWGIELSTEQSVLDPQLGLDIRGAQGGVVRHPGILGITAEQLNSSDIITANLDTLNFNSAGTLSVADDSALKQTPLITTSGNGAQVATSHLQGLTDPSELSRFLADDGAVYTLAARYTGKISSAYSEANDEGGEYIANNASANIVVIADADMLTDRFWVQQSNFFGQTVFTPFANNGDLLINAVDNLVGSTALISVRSRGTYSRPFTRVEAIEVAAQARFREQEQRLQNQLAETEQQLAQLQARQEGANTLVLSVEEQAAIDEFVEKRIAIRQALREVRFELQRDIDVLGNKLKLYNIALAPLLLTLLLVLISKLLRRPVKLEQQGA